MHEAHRELYCEVRIVLAIASSYVGGACSKITFAVAGGLVVLRVVSALLPLTLASAVLTVAVRDLVCGEMSSVPLLAVIMLFVSSREEAIHFRFSHCVIGVRIE